MGSTGTFTNNYAGMQYRVSGLPTTEGDKIVRLTVTDEHTNVEGDLTNPASSTGGGSGSFHRTKHSHGNADVTFDISDDVLTNFVLTKGSTYKAVIDVAYVPITGLTKELEYMPIPPADFYEAEVQHANAGLSVSAAPAGTNTDAYVVTYYVVTIYPSITSQTAGTAAAFTWQKRYPVTTPGVLEQQDIDKDTVDGADTTMGANMNNDSSYEVIVVAENASGLSEDAKTYHVTPRSTPNNVTTFTANGGIDMPAYIADNAVVMDDKIEFNIEGGTPVGPASHPNDTGIIVKLTGGTNATLYKYFPQGDGIPGSTTPSVASEVVTSASTGWRTTLTNLSVNGAPTSITATSGADVAPSILDGTTYTLNAFAINTVGPGVLPGVTASATSSGLPITPSVELNVGYGAQQVKVSVGGAGSAYNTTDVDNGSAITKYTVSYGTAPNVTTSDYDVPLLSNAGNTDYPRYFFVSPPLADRPYRPSTGVTVGAAKAASQYNDEGFMWNTSGTPFQINLLRNVLVTAYSVANPPTGSVEYWNGDRTSRITNGVADPTQMPDGNWVDPEWYSLVINTAGNMNVYSHGAANPTVVEATTQWTITGWGQTVLRGTIDTTTVPGTTRLVVKDREYRPFDSVIGVNPQEVFTGTMYTEVAAYSFIGAPADFGEGTALTVEIDTTPTSYGVQLGLEGVTLADGTSYDLTVSATNYNGSTAAAPVTVVPRTDPNAPLFTSCAPHINVMSSLGSGTVRGDITALDGASQTGGDEQITYVFSLVDNTNGENITDISGVGLTSAVFTGLDDGSNYTMSVQAINSFSEAGPVSVCGTDLVPSIPPTVDVSATGSPMSAATTNLVVTASHNRLEVNPNLSVSTGGYPTVGMKVSATNVSGTSGTHTINVPLTNATYTPTELFNSIVGSGAQDDHEYILTFTPYNAVYQFDHTDGVGYDPAPVSTADGEHAHATNAKLPSTPIFVSANTTDGGKLSYTVNTPNWVFDGNWQYTRGTTISYIVSSCAPTQTIAGGLITYPGDGDGDTYTAPTEAESQDLVAGTANTINLEGLRNGTKYKIAVTAHSKQYHDEGPTMAAAPSSVEGDIPYTKPTISWTNAAGTTTGTTYSASNNYMRIASNGRALDDTIMINSLSNVDNLGVVSHKAALLTSTETLYGGANSSIAVPFTDYITSTGSVAQLYSKSQRSTGTNNNYILITENLAGASIDISGQVVGVNNTSSN
jgi:hypothetical protein